MVDMLRERGRGAHPRRRRRRRHDRAARGRGARSLRRREDLHAGRRPAARPQRHDRGRVPARARVVAARRSSGRARRRATTRSRSRAPSRCSRQRSTRPRASRGLRSARWQQTLNRPPVVGITGTGGAGKSIAHRRAAESHRSAAFPDRRIAVVAIDPTRRRTGGALLGDRIRMNSLARRAHLHALASRRAASTSRRAPCSRTPSQLLKYAGFDLVVRRDGGHRAERHRDRRPRRPLDLRDDERVRRGEPAREDRHARLRGPRRAQQVREARRRGRAARRAQAVEAQPQAVQDAADEGAGVPDDREPFNDAGRQSRSSARCAAQLHEQWGRLRPWRRQGLAPVGSAERARPSSRPARALPRGDRARRPRRRARPRSSAAAAAASRAHGCYRALAALGDAALPAPLDRSGDADRAPADATIARLRRAYNAALDDVGAEGVALLRGVAGARARPRPADEYTLPRARPRGARAELHARR